MSDNTLTLKEKNQLAKEAKDAFPHDLKLKELTNRSYYYGDSITTRPKQDRAEIAFMKSKYLTPIRDYKAEIYSLYKKIVATEKEITTFFSQIEDKQKRGENELVRKLKQKEKELANAAITEEITFTLTDDGQLVKDVVKETDPSILSKLKEDFDKQKKYSGIKEHILYGKDIDVSVDDQLSDATVIMLYNQNLMTTDNNKIATKIANCLNNGQVVDINGITYKVKGINE